MTPARRLAAWIEANYPYKDALTHLKLQKLMFYCAGVALAFDQESDLGGPIPFEPWGHGPVNREVWRSFRHFKAAPLPTGDEFVRLLDVLSDNRTYSATTHNTMFCALKVYGALDAWSLRCQTHLERPWQNAYTGQLKVIDAEAIRGHFRAKYRAGPVSSPEWVLDPGTFKIDGLPVRTHRSLQDLAESVYRSAKLSQC